MKTSKHCLFPLHIALPVEVMHFFLWGCPGFGQDWVNFHQNPGRDTAVWANPLASGGGGAGQQELTRGSGPRGGGRWERLSLRSVLFCVIPLICIILVTVPFVCCSVKLPLSRPTGFCPFLSHLLCTLVWGGEATWRFLLPAAAKP